MFHKAGEGTKALEDGNELPISGHNDPLASKSLWLENLPRTGRCEVRMGPHLGASGQSQTRGP